MYVEPFVMHRPERLDEAVELRACLGEEATLYAGGTELVLAMKMGVLRYDHLVDLKRVDGLGGIAVEDGVLHIGATATHREIEQSPTVAAALPSLATLVRNVANIRVRAMGTLAGNLAFGEPHADPPALLTALGASVRLRGPQGERRLPVEEFLLGGYETALAHDELIAAISIPLPDPATRVRYVRFKVIERPTVGVAVAGRIVDGAFVGPPAIVVGAVDETPRRLAADELAGIAVTDKAAIAATAERVQEVIEPIDDLAGTADYKRRVAKTYVRRALMVLSEKGGP